MKDILSVAVVVGVALGVFIVLVALRLILEAIHRTFFRPRETPLLATRINEHLEAMQAPRTVGDWMDRFFARMVGRSSLQLSPAQAAGYVFLVGVLAGGAMYLWQERLELSIGTALLAMSILLGVFWFLHWRWRKVVQDQLPDTFHLLARSLRAGLTVDQSVSLIASQGLKPLSNEFRRCAAHLELGMTVPIALEMTAARLNLPDFDLLASLVALHRQTGGNLPQILDRLANAVRSRNHFRGHVAAVTALGRLSGYFLAVAAPMFMILYWFANPAYLTRLTENSMGIFVLTTAIVLEVIGVIWMFWLLRIDY